MIEMVTRILLAVALLALLANSSVVIPKDYPLYKQCDPRWADHLMGGEDECKACNRESATLCEQGCAMSCVSMFLSGYGINGSAVTPDSLNSWLRTHNGYLCLGGDCNNLSLKKIEEAAASGAKTGVNVSYCGEAQKPSYQQLQQWILKLNMVVIAHVRNNSHFVLLRGWDPAVPDSFLVRDPGFNVTVYPYANITDVILYAVQPTQEQLAAVQTVLALTPAVTVARNEEDIATGYRSIGGLLPH